jgi:hypothetical protein
LIFTQLSLDLNQVLYLRIFLGSDSFRSPPSTRIDPSYLTWIQVYLLVESVLYKLDVPIYKKVSYLKQRSLFVLHIFVLLGLLTRVLTRTLTWILTRDYAWFLTRVATQNLTRDATRVIPKAFRESYQDTYPIGLTRPYPSAYPIAYPALPEGYPVEYPALLEAYPAR